MKIQDLTGTHQNRREFISSLSSGITGLSMMMIFGGCERLLDQIQNRPMRRYIRPGSAAAQHDVDIYRAAVAAMKALPAADPRNWTKQAEIHQNHCPHGNWFFLPWHRAYLFYFEQICRELTGEKNWGLPYWNWSAQRSVPAPFWGLPSNALFHTPRLATSASQTPSPIFDLSTLNDVLDEPNFLLFASAQASALRPQVGKGIFEGDQHDTLHGFVGGTMGSFMSPLDPIFWTHHNMVDYCWSEWNITRNHANTNDTAWINFSLANMFVDRVGDPTEPTVLTTLLMPFLSYQYEASPTSVAAPLANRITLGKKSENELKMLKKALETGVSTSLDFKKKISVDQVVVISSGEPANVQFKLDSGIFDKLSPNTGSGRGDRALLTIATADSQNSSGNFVRVFINKPDANAETKTDDPHYAGSFAFFGDDHHNHASSVNYIVDITKSIQNSRKAGEITSDGFFNIRLVAVPIRPGSTKTFKFRVEKMDLGISEISVKRLIE